MKDGKERGLQKNRLRGQKEKEEIEKLRKEFKGRQEGSVL